jgi:hypothetical protein
MRAALLPALFGLTALAETVVHEFPHLIIPLDVTAPDKAYNTQSTFMISNFVCVPKSLSSCISTKPSVELDCGQLGRAV